MLLLAGEYDVGLPPRNAAEYAGLFEHAEFGGAARRRALSLARRSRVVHADTGGLSRLTASRSSVAATVAPGEMYLSVHVLNCHEGIPAPCAGKNESGLLVSGEERFG